MSERTLAQWLEYIERIHPKAIALGLERIAEVRDRLGCEFRGTVITVAGTNGKGSTCAMLEAILRAAGYRTGLYSSPHLLAYNERVRVDGRPVDDAALCRAFERVERARGGVQLTYFEFGTLAAWVLFCDAALEALVLEVGMGGRLDAVNAFHSHCAIVTSVGIDHTDYLGETREAIGAEKAGIFRRARPAIVAERSPPASVVERAAAIGADLWLAGRDYRWSVQGAQWSWRGRRGSSAGLAWPALRGEVQLQNASACLAALEALHPRLPVEAQAVRRGLASVQLVARFQVLPGRPAVVLDVAHNPHAAEALARNLAAMGHFSRTWAVFGMLNDKDIAGVCRALGARIDAWLVCPPGGPRGAGTGEIASAVRASGAAGEIVECETPASALSLALGRAGQDDRIVVFGSFLTVADVMAARTRRPN